MSRSRIGERKESEKALLVAARQNSIFGSIRRKEIQQGKKIQRTSVGRVIMVKCQDEQFQIMFNSFKKNSASSLCARTILEVRINKINMYYNFLMNLWPKVRKIKKLTKWLKYGNKIAVNRTQSRRMFMLDWEVRESIPEEMRKIFLTVKVCYWQ